MCSVCFYVDVCLRTCVLHCVCVGMRVWACVCVWCMDVCTCLCIYLCVIVCATVSVKLRGRAVRLAMCSPPWPFWWCDELLLTLHHAVGILSLGGDNSSQLCQALLSMTSCLSHNVGDVPPGMTFKYKEFCTWNCTLSPLVSLSPHWQPCLNVAAVWFLVQPETDVLLWLLQCKMLALCLNEPHPVGHSAGPVLPLIKRVLTPRNISNVSLTNFLRGT